jgi:hypothetical protein
LEKSFIAAEALRHPKSGAKQIKATLEFFRNWFCIRPNLGLFP